MEFEPLEKVLLKTMSGAKVANPARYVGFNGRKYVFEPTTIHFSRFKHGSKLVFLSERDIDEHVIKLK